MSDSILSHGERAVASMLADGMTVEEIAEERDMTPETAEQSIDRIREKTDRALATLAESPFTREAMDPETANWLGELLEEVQSDQQ